MPRARRAGLGLPRGLSVFRPPQAAGVFCTRLSVLSASGRTAGWGVRYAGVLPDADSGPGGQSGGGSTALGGQLAFLLGSPAALEGEGIVRLSREEPARASGAAPAHAFRPSNCASGARRPLKEPPLRPRRGRPLGSRCVLCALDPPQKDPRVRCLPPAEILGSGLPLARGAVSARSGWDAAAVLGSTPPQGTSHLGPAVILGYLDVVHLFGGAVSVPCEGVRLPLRGAGLRYEAPPCQGWPGEAVSSRVCTPLPRCTAGTWDCRARALRQCDWPGRQRRRTQGQGTEEAERQHRHPAQALDGMWRGSRTEVGWPGGFALGPLACGRASPPALWKGEKSPDWSPVPGSPV